MMHDKLHACYFCRKLVTNICRHYVTIHKREARVQEILAVDDCRLRADEIDRLRLVGDYHHNLHVLSEKTGQLIVVRRPTANSNLGGADFLPCQFCLGFFYRNELWRHCSGCKFRDGAANSFCIKNALLLVTPPVYSAGHVSNELRHVLAVMSDDKVSRVAKNDLLILTYGASLASNKPSSRFRRVSGRMRTLAKLLIRLRMNTSQYDADLMYFIKPDKFDDVVTAVQQEAEHEAGTSSSSVTLGCPSVALKMGSRIRQCALLVVNWALRDRSVVLERDASTFARLYDCQWHLKMSSVAPKTKLLPAVENGNLDALRGRNSDDIDFAHIPDVDYSSEADDIDHSADVAATECDEQQPVVTDVAGSCEFEAATASASETVAQSCSDVKAAAQSSKHKSEVLSSVSHENRLKTGSSSAIRSRRRNPKRRWSHEEKRAVLTNLGTYIRDGTVPGKSPCMRAIRDSGEVLSSRDWRQVKYTVKNMLSSAKRQNLHGVSDNLGGLVA